MSTDIAVRAIVPIMVEKMPPVLPISAGFVARNLKLMTGSPFFKTKKMMKKRTQRVREVKTQREAVASFCSVRGLR